MGIPSGRLPGSLSSVNFQVGWGDCFVSPSISSMMLGSLFFLG